MDLRIPAYTLVDAAISYDLGRKFPSLKGAKISVNVSNLFDKYYVADCGGIPDRFSTCHFGSASTVLTTLAYRWWPLPICELWWCHRGLS